MNSHSFGFSPRITVFGQSHDRCIGVLIDGFPAGVTLDQDAIDRLLARRRPGQGATTTARRETDAPIVESGIVDHVTTGDRIRVVFENKDVRGKDYEKFRTVPRPSHADYLATEKYGGDHDIAGGGRFSGRLTLPVTYAGALCLQVLHKQGISIRAKLVEVDGETSQFDERITQARDAGDSVGGIVEVVATGIPAGIGEHPYGGVEPVLSSILLSIPGARGVEFGAGFEAARMRGSEHNDAWIMDDGRVATATNNAGGVIGGMTTGMPVVIRVAFKPTASISREQVTLNLETGHPEPLSITGRHDPCIAVRALPVVEAAVAIGLLNLINVDSSTGEENLDGLRRRIDTVDDALVELLIKRRALTEEIGAFKRAHDLPIPDDGRETRILDRLTSGQDDDAACYLRAIYEVIFALSKKQQIP